MKRRKIVSSIIFWIKRRRYSKMRRRALANIEEMIKMNPAEASAHYERKGTGHNFNLDREVTTGMYFQRFGHEGLSFEEIALLLKNINFLKEFKGLSVQFLTLVKNQDKVGEFLEKPISKWFPSFSEKEKERALHFIRN